MRGLEVIIKAIGNTNYKLLLAGEFSEKKFYKQVIKLPGWKNVVFMGKVSRSEIIKIAEKSFVGIITFLSTPNHIYSQPNKIFEYMSMKLPVICSNFDLWKLIVEDNNCGICISPTKPNEILNAIKHIYNNPKTALEMGNNGSHLVKTRYNWEVEEKKTN